MSQTEKILDCLRSGNTITPAEALEWYGCFRLAARIADAKALLADDEVIVTERYHTPRGAIVARYRLVRREPAQVTLW